MGPYLFSAALFGLTIAVLFGLARAIRERARRRLQALEQRLDRMAAHLASAPTDSRIERLAARVRSAREDGRFSRSTADRLLSYLFELNEELRGI